MAAAAKASRTDAEDFLFWEVEVMHPPESEIYGRSLSTIRRLGALMIKGAASEVISSPEAAQAKVEFYTSVEEGFGTDMELGGGLEVRDFDARQIIGGKVMAKDLKTPISSMTESGLKCAMETANRDRRFRPQLRRSEWDHENALIVDKMARGETAYNTRIVVSPFPEEAAAESGNEYWRNIGYVPHLKRGFVQLYHVTKEGVLLSGSLSFDGSDKQRLREIFGRFGKGIPESEITDDWLRHAITGTLSEEEAKALATEIADTAGDRQYKKTTNTVDVTKQYGSIMERAFNESYIHICESLARGQQTGKARELIFQLAQNAHHFNDRYASALYRLRADSMRFSDDDSVMLHELLVYSTIEMMRALHLNKMTSQASTDFVPGYLGSTDYSSFQDMLSGFGAEGAKNNRIYSACGIAIKAGGKNTDFRPQSVFGGLDQLGEETEEDNKIPSTINCIVCKKSSPKEKVVRKDSWYCPHCEYEVDICNGEVLHESKVSNSSKTRIAELIVQMLEEHRKKTVSHSSSDVLAQAA